MLGPLEGNKRKLGARRRGSRGCCLVSLLADKGDLCFVIRWVMGCVFFTLWVDLFLHNDTRTVHVCGQFVHVKW